MTRTPHKLSIAFLLLLTLAGCRWPWQSEGPSTTITLSGTVEAHQADLAFQVGGRMTELKVDEGDAVAAGDAVATLDSQDLTLAVQQAEANKNAAAAALAALNAGSRPQELRVAEATVAKAEAERDFAASDIKRVEDLLPQKLATQAQLDGARMQQRLAIAALQQANQTLALLREGPRVEDIHQAEAVFAARGAALDSARRQLDYTHLVSPVSGVVSLRLAEQGEVVAPGQPVLRVAELARPWVRAYLNESDLARVKLGQATHVTVDGLPGQVFQGHLSFISPVAEFTPKTVETHELRVALVYRVKVEVDDPQQRLKIGMPADVTLDAATTP